MTMIEKVAIALFKIQDKYPTGSDWETCGETWKQHYRNMARAAIEAMREPTEEMLNVDAPDMPAGGSIDEVWKAMIDKALGV